MVNHWWQVPLYVNARGVTTSAIPAGTRTFEIAFDFVDHRLRIDTSDGATRSLALAPRSVAEFYRELMANLDALGVGTRIWPRPVEVQQAVPFAEDHAHASYDPEHARRLWQALVQADRVLTRFRARFLGKASPVHLFWGGLDLAVTRFSGRRAPRHPGGVPNVGDWVMHEAYSHEVSSCGFWPGDESMFYAYAYPEPAGFAAARVEPGAAYYHPDLREFVLPYDAVRTAERPDEALMAFLQSTYEAAADLGHWDRAALERAGALSA
ncbi:MAG: hypothetical protein AUI36_04040 [Cyanobacteria bacterium 13_1_40CM_2_61_4]|nr:MAG: hypothetical protein AUI36_04040 [Cyanobacteria bacterium 13_1_40CM_2_61_4]